MRVFDQLFLLCRRINRYRSHYTVWISSKVRVQLNVWQKYVFFISWWGCSMFCSMFSCLAGLCLLVSILSIKHSLQTDWGSFPHFSPSRWHTERETLCHQGCSLHEQNESCPYPTVVHAETLSCAGARGDSPSLCPHALEAGSGSLSAALLKFIDAEGEESRCCCAVFVGFLPAWDSSVLQNPIQGSLRSPEHKGDCLVLENTK